ncbi:hypothetical protein MTR_4g082850 [Medicago truncatula]|uniref:Uncharacterized protein n=1 Tax=Medicago truncatula TaxID=3880 RepID=G7JGC8_MEDTR|nr:hypothetical protein MTR_4g082850 [Medicago truncatula]
MDKKHPEYQNEIKVTFSYISALNDVKESLQEAVILPLRGGVYSVSRKGGDGAIAMSRRFGTQIEKQDGERELRRSACCVVDKLVWNPCIIG